MTQKKQKNRKFLNKEASPPLTFAQRFLTLSKKYSPLCVGLDPSLKLLQSWGLPLSSDGLKEFCERFLESALGEVAILKPQVAFFEAFGPEGFFVLKDFIQKAKKQGLLVIADVKRGDVGHSFEAYSQAWLNEEFGFAADALTVQVYFGYEALSSVVELADQKGLGVFVVLRSSNLSGRALQNAKVKGQPLADFLAEQITEDNKKRCSEDSIGPIGAVIGAPMGSKEIQEELREEKRSTIQKLTHSLFLVPGLGVQGGNLKDIKEVFSMYCNRVIPSVSRSILFKGPDVKELKKAIRFYSNAVREFVK